jgi:large subunit ribosomal protein L4
LIVVDEFSLSSHKTSDFNSILSALNLQDKKITILVTGRDANLDKASRNLRNVYLVDAAKVSTYDIIDCDTLVVDKVSMSVLTEILKK